jgi:hypothetical protein
MDTDHSQYTLAELEAMPTLCISQSDDLKVEDGDTRVWLARTTVLDGEPFDNRVTVERYDGRRWVDDFSYQAH